MKLEGTTSVAASARDVWALVIDPLTLVSCVAGVREVHRVDDRVRLAGAVPE